MSDVRKHRYYTNVRVRVRCKSPLYMFESMVQQTGQQLRILPKADSDTSIYSDTSIARNRKSAHFTTH